MASGRVPRTTRTLRRLAGMGTEFSIVDFRYWIEGRLPYGSYLIAFGFCPFDRAADNKVVVECRCHDRDPELAISKIHHEGQQNVHQRVFPRLARQGDDKLQDKRGISENPDQAIRAEH